MAMVHTRFGGCTPQTGIPQWSGTGGTDSMQIFATDSGVTYELVSTSSPYGTIAAKVTPNGNGGSWYWYLQGAVPELRCSFVFDMPKVTSASWYFLSIGCDDGNVRIAFTTGGAWVVEIAGAVAYWSNDGLMPAAGTRVRLAVGVLAAGTNSAWHAAVFNDSTGAQIDTTQSGKLTSWTSTELYETQYFGRAAGGWADDSVLIRSVRVETGPGCVASPLPAESALAPVDPASAALVPWRLISTVGSATTPSGQSLITNLADANTGTTGQIPSGTTTRFALKPAQVSRGGMSLALNGATGDGLVSLSLYGGNTGRRIGTVKTATLTSTPTDVSVSWPSSEMGNVAATDFEALELEVSA